MLVRQLSATSALSRALNDGAPPWDRTDHLIADLWALWAKQDHPRRAAMEAKARNAQKLEKRNRMRAKHAHLLTEN